MSELPGSDPSREREKFAPEVLDKSVIAVPLLRQLNEEQRALTDDPGRRPTLHPVIIDLNLDYQGGRDEARRRAAQLVAEAVARARSGRAEGGQAVNEAKSRLSSRYLFARLEGAVIRELVRLDGERDPEAIAEAGISAMGHRAIFRIWPDFEVRPLINHSVSTVKADAARASFSAFGEGMVWAVLDSGIDGAHPHFVLHANLVHPPGLAHQDFTGGDGALDDDFGHGTHVAGIIAGALTVREQDPPIRAFSRHRDEHGEVTYEVLSLRSISGMAPKCKLLSLKVLDGAGDGLTSNLIAAIEYVQRLNDYGRRLVIHGVNLSVGYDFEPEWFACGQSPLCVEVDRLVQSGVVVVAAAGNTGYGWHQSAFRGPVAAGMDLTINDPGNAELAITVGSTHRDMPHVYGVSYFSSKGPTGDGRLKPDLVAPGEKILSCAAGKRREEARKKGAECDYVEDSGTSMAAPHVSGVIAAFLSVRREFIGKPHRVKEIFLSTATDLKRERHFQGHGLVDLMRAIQSV